MRGILGHWYADPIDAETAHRLLKHCHARRRGRRPITRTLELAARFQLNEAIDFDYRLLADELRPHPHTAALLELVYGQLLISRKLRAGLNHLKRAERLAARLFTPGDYFTVVERHELLAELALDDTPSPALPLESLLTEAHVIRRLRGPRRPIPVSDHSDTMD